MERSPAPTAPPTGFTWPGSPAWSTTVSLTEIRWNVVFTFYLTAILILAKIFKKCAHSNDKSDSPVLVVVDQMASAMMIIVEFVMVLWGSVEVYEARTCTDFPTSLAFSILILKWVSGGECRLVFFWNILFAGHIHTPRLLLLPSTSTFPGEWSFKPKYKRGLWGLVNTLRFQRRHPVMTQSNPDPWIIYNKFYSEELRQRTSHETNVQA